MSQTIHIKGLSELQKFLDLLPAKVEANVLRGALFVGAKVIRDEAKRLVPVAPPNAKNRRVYGGYAGALRDSIRAGSGIDKRTGKVIAYVRAGSHGKSRKGKGSDAYYAKWVEYGTKAHVIKAKKGGKSARSMNRKLRNGSLRIGDVYVGAEVMHPGSRPRPFLRPALDGRAKDALMAAALYMRKRLATKEGLSRASEVELEAV
ncbi:MAG: HK97-gp10 family putative phage morphogenesis protein [Pseudomonadota bacterium]